MKVGCMCLLVGLVLPGLVCSIFDFRATKVSNAFCHMRRGFDTLRPVDCAVRCSRNRAICVGIVVDGPRCFNVLSLLTKRWLDESNINQGDTRIYVLNASLAVCPRSSWNFTSEVNLTSVYYLQDDIVECKRSGNRPAVISSLDELRVLYQIRLQVGHPVLTGAWANGSIWRWSAGQEAMRPELWKGQVLPDPIRNSFGAISDGQFLTGIQPNGGEKFVCECYEVFEL